MHRIDSPNARPNLNGPGKTGFSDNTDLSGQDATYLSPDWFNAVQEELAGVVEASGAALNKGNNGQLLTALHAIFASDAQLTEVDSRLTAAITALSAATQQAIIDERNRLYPIGTGLYIVYDDNNPADTLGWGTWQLVSKGRALVGLTDDPVAPTWTQTVGGTAGEYEHTLTVDELAGHHHSTAPYNKFAARAIEALSNGDAATDVGGSGFGITVASADNFNPETEMQVADISPEQWLSMTESGAGGGQPHNNVQPSFVVAVWRRVG